MAALFFGACEPPPLDVAGGAGIDEKPAGIIAANSGETPLWEQDINTLELTTDEGLVELLNAAREALRMGTVVIDPHLTEAATAHAEYLALHKGSYEDGQTSVHAQIPGAEGFVGEGYSQRAAHFGYEGNCFSEVVAFKPTAVGAMRSWLESLYHRVPLLEPTAMHVGYGEAEADGVMVNVVEVGRHE